MKRKEHNEICIKCFSHLEFFYGVAGGLLKVTCPECGVKYLKENRNDNNCISNDYISGNSCSGNANQ